MEQTRACAPGLFPVFSSGIVAGCGYSRAAARFRRLYARGRHRNLQIARDVKRAIIDFARAHGTTVSVFERLKHFRPKGGRRRSSLRQRLHGRLRRLLVKRVEMTARERGWKAAFVNPRGTSKYAFDGGGE